MALKTWEPKRLPVRPGTAADTMRQACPLAQPRQAHRSSVEIERSGDAAAYEFRFVQIMFDRMRDTTSTGAASLCLWYDYYYHE